MDSIKPTPLCGLNRCSGDAVRQGVDRITSDGFQLRGWLSTKRELTYRIRLSDYSNRVPASRIRDSRARGVWGDCGAGLHQTRWLHIRESTFRPSSIHSLRRSGTVSPPPTILCTGARHCYKWSSPRRGVWCDLEALTIHLARLEVRYTGRLSGYRFQVSTHQSY